MQFKPLLFLVAAFPFTQAQAAPTAKDVVDAIHNITDISAGALDIATNISSMNILGSALKITDDLRKIVTDVANDVKTLQGNTTLPQFSDRDQAEICEALGGFAKTHQDFFKALANKKIFLDATTLTEPIGALLVLLRAGLDHLAEGVIALVPTCGVKARDELKDLDKTLGETISTFSVHAPDVPSVQPPVATNESLNATNHPIPASIPAPRPGVVGSPLGGAIGAGGKPTEISATGPIGTPVAAPVGGQ
ncbi:uncharacterized protein TrAtP1_008999 [Trichoderma atroviride]|uniref:Cell wall protein n=1 Tax=Hypocrea atroviridis (strain ATCC 20476 / IMI 206040) TaxID=452589 RepID=G9NYE1_HYPAI|nr:uncharacterized protein TRIATDRAFT_87493 [Trichoderma atroviride IMI 206040]EHK44455.1 hypothetical protein TRIATDRAFT_87493 [Trichoderma atroviride IMI 206040]UKZ67841.1 hypothetical protein TrAtP1_008999 [Trichoderma atroviride]